jgi:hypothetical protein
MFDLCKFVERLEQTGNPDFGILRARVEQERRLSAERKLRDKYEIDYVERSDKRRLMDLLRSIEEGARLPDRDVLWLKAKEYFSLPLKHVFHKHEAAFYRQRFEQSNDPWDAVNGCSHYRKARLAPEALTLLEKVDIDAHGSKHLQSALCTTKGGALRDMRRFDEALTWADRAHVFEPASFHPCTLFGAIHYELGNHALGDEWFSKAVARGANRNSVDDELRSIFMRSRGERRDEMKRHLLSLDPARYDWVNQGKDKRKSRPA